ncbi:MAG: selenium-dependent molybdenum cofactor biosynthesis protein YqeB [Elusimicrobiota bacterium]
MNFADIKVLIKGGGDLGSGIAFKLFRSGFNTSVVDLPQPMCIRRTVSFSSAIKEGEITIDGVTGILAHNISDFSPSSVSVFTSENNTIINALNPAVIIDATLKAIDNRTTKKQDAPLTIGLGPGFKAPEDIDCIIETNRGHNLGKVIWKGTAEQYTGIPGIICGHSQERLIRAPDNGIFEPAVKIGDTVEKGDLLGTVNRKSFHAAISGVIRGLISDTLPVTKNMKIGDIDPRGNRDSVYTVSDKARCIAGGVLEAILYWMHTGKEKSHG